MSIKNAMVPYNLNTRVFFIESIHLRITQAISEQKAYKAQQIRSKIYEMNMLNIKLISLFF